MASSRALSDLEVMHFMKRKFQALSTVITNIHVASGKIGVGKDSLSEIDGILANTQTTLKLTDELYIAAIQSKSNDAYEKAINRYQSVIIGLSLHLAKILQKNIGRLPTLNDSKNHYLRFIAIALQFVTDANKELFSNPAYSGAQGQMILSIRQQLPVIEMPNNESEVVKEAYSSLNRPFQVLKLYEKQIYNPATPKPSKESALLNSFAKTSAAPSDKKSGVERGVFSDATAAASVQPNPVASQSPAVSATTASDDTLSADDLAAMMGEYDRTSSRGAHAVAKVSHSNVASSGSAASADGDTMSADEFEAMLSEHARTSNRGAIAGEKKVEPKNPKVYVKPQRTKLTSRLAIASPTNGSTTTAAAARDVKGYDRSARRAGPPPLPKNLKNSSTVKIMNAGIQQEENIKKLPWKPEKILKSGIKVRSVAGVTSVIDSTLGKFAKPKAKANKSKDPKLDAIPERDVDSVIPSPRRKNK